MKTAVEIIREHFYTYAEPYNGFSEEPKWTILEQYFEKLIQQAKEMEKEQLLQMSLKSAHYERKWILEHSTESQYNPSKVEIRDLEKTALEHYNETFNNKNNENRNH